MNNNASYCQENREKQSIPRQMYAKETSKLVNNKGMQNNVEKTLKTVSNNLMQNNVRKRRKR